jgi:hypothetical protein
MKANTTIKLYEKQLKGLMIDKAKYRQPYFVIIEGYQKLIAKHNLSKEFDDVMIELIRRYDMLQEKELKEKKGK